MLNLQRRMAGLLLAGALCMPALRVYADGDVLPTATPSAVPTATVTGSCVGECNGHRKVEVSELLVMVNVALGNTPASVCARGDQNGDDAITIDEILGAMNDAVAGCPVEPTATPTPGEPIILYSADPQAAGNPFPSDRLLDATGHVQVSGSRLDPGLPPTAAYQAARDYFDGLAEQLQAFTGFGTYAPIRIPVGAPVVIDSSDHPAGIMLLNFDDPGAPPPVVHAVYYAPDADIEVQPVAPLQPQTTYAIVITTALTDTRGNPVQPSADFLALLGGTLPLRTRLDPLIAYLASQGTDTDSLALIELFTTQAITDDLLAIRDRLDSGALIPGAPVFDNSPIPGLVTGIFPEGTAGFQGLVGTSSSPNISTVAIGSFDSYDFRTGVDGPFDPSLISGPAVPGVNHLDFYMTIPKALRPPNGYPIIIYGHGLYGSGRDVVSVPQTIGDAPMIGIAISALHNGLRGESATFFDFGSVTATREYLRQTGADLLQFRRMITSAQQAMTPPFDQIDPEHVLYFGGSLGAILGTMFMAIEPDVEVAMLSVPGGGIATALTSPYLTTIVTPHIVQQTGIPFSDPFYPRMWHRLQQILQWTWDAGDPINYAPYVVVPGAQLPNVPAKLILMHEGITDTILPNPNEDALAAVFQLPDVKASRGCTDPSGCSGIWRYVMSDYHQIPSAGHAVTSLIPQAQAQAAEYLNSFGTIITDATP